MVKNILETERLMLRELTMQDLDDLYALYSDPKVMKYHVGRPYSYEETKEVLKLHFIDYDEHGFGLWAAILKANKRIIGRCGLEPTETEDGIVGDIAWLLAKEYWRQGLGTECGIALVEYGFKKLGLKRITATSHPDNVASIRIMQKIGMTYEGRLDKNKRGGERVLYSIRSNQWLESH